MPLRVVLSPLAYLGSALPLHAPLCLTDSVRRPTWSSSACLISPTRQRTFTPCPTKGCVPEPPRPTLNWPSPSCPSGNGALEIGTWGGRSYSARPGPRSPLSMGSPWTWLSPRSPIHHGTQALPLLNQEAEQVLLLLL